MDKEERAVRENLQAYGRLKEKVNASVERQFAMNQEEFAVWKKKRLKAVLQNAKERSPFYREKYRDILMDEEFYRQEDYLEKLPFTSKEEIAAQYPFGLLAADKKEIVRYGESSGTTGTPINAYCTGEDWMTNNRIVAEWLSGILVPEDIVALIVPYELALVGQDLDRAVEMIGAAAIAIGALSKCVETERVIRLLKELKVTAVVCSPTRILFLAEEIKKLGLSPKKDFRVRKFLCPGEGMSPEKTALIHRIWDADIYPMYGMTETNTLAMPCRCGRLHLADNKAFFELLDPATGKRVRDKSRGELVVTTLVKGMPLIRYRTGDLCTIEERPCECGGRSPVLQHHGRIQDRIKTGGKEYQILDIEAAVLGAGGVKFYTLRAKEGQPLEIGLVCGQGQYEETAAGIRAAVKERLGLETVTVPTTMEKIEEVIKISIKPSIKSILLD